jgi:hypothetical protein
MALGIGSITEVTSRLFREYTKQPWAIEARAKAHAKARDPERCRKIAEAHRGKPRPRHVIEAMHQAWRGSHHTEEIRRRMSRTHTRRGTMAPGTKVWTAEEDELVRKLLVEEAAKKTGRSLSAVSARRKRLRVSDKEDQGGREK